MYTIKGVCIRRNTERREMDEGKKDTERQKYKRRKITLDDVYRKISKKGETPEHLQCHKTMYPKKALYAMRNKYDGYVVKLYEGQAPRKCVRTTEMPIIYTLKVTLRDCLANKTTMLLNYNRPSHAVIASKIDPNAVKQLWIFDASQIHHRNARNVVKL